MANTSRAQEKIPAQSGGQQGIPEHVIDIAHLDMHTFNDRALRIELLGIFGQQLDEYVAALERADRHNAWVAAAHTLKGSARAIGARNLADLCELMESLGPDEWQAGQADAVCRLKPCVCALRSAIRAITASQ